MVLQSARQVTRNVGEYRGFREETEKHHQSDYGDVKSGLISLNGRCMASLKPVRARIMKRATSVGIIEKEDTLLQLGEQFSQHSLSTHKLLGRSREALLQARKLSFLSISRI